MARSCNFEQLLTALNLYPTLLKRKHSTESKQSFSINIICAMACRQEGEGKTVQMML